MLNCEQPVDRAHRARGGARQEQESVVWCDPCAAEHPADARYCMRCGRALTSGDDVDARAVVLDRRRHAPAEAAYFRQLLEQLPLGAFVATLRPEARLLYVTPYVAATLGIPAAAVAGDPNYWLTLIHPDDRPRVTTAVDELVRTGEPLQFECRVLCPDGRERWWHAYAVVVEGPANPAAYVVGFCEDVTDRRRDEEALRQARQREGRLEGVTLAARDLAHILNNDLSIGVAALDLLQQRGRLQLDLAELVRDAAEALQHAAQHVEKLQRVVRIETRETPVGPALDLERSIQG
jgi:PAS domain S-box-containing protein